MPSLQPLGYKKGHEGCINSVKFDFSGVYCMTTGNDRCVKLWNPSKLLLIKNFFGPHNHEVFDVCLSKDNTKFVSVGAEHSAFYWDTLEGKVVRKFNHGDKIRCSEFIADGNVLCTGSDDKCVKLWDCRGRNPLQTFPDAKDSIYAISEELDTIISASIDGSVRQYDLRMGILRIDVLSSPVISIQLSSVVKDCFVAGELNDTISLIEGGKVLKSFRGHNCGGVKVNCLMDPLEQLVISGSSSGDIHYWVIGDSDSSSKILKKGAHEGVITSIAFSNPRLVNDGKLKGDLEKNQRELLLSDSVVMVSVGRDGFLRAWKYMS